MNRNSRRRFGVRTKCRKCGAKLVNKAEQGSVCPKCGWFRKSFTKLDFIDAKEEADRIAKEEKEARIKAEKAVSQFIGQVGDKVDITAAYKFSAYFTTKIGWQEETMYIHNFKDESGNTLIWKTTKGIGSLNLQEGDLVHIKGTIKEHSVYKDEKQTALIRCKIEK